MYIAHKMTEKEIKFKVINELNGTKSMSKQQVDDSLLSI